MPFYSNRKGAEINKKDNYGMTALFYAANEEIVELLVKRGANVNETAKRNETPLFQAVASGKVHAVQGLLKAEANVNHKSFNGTALISFLKNRSNYGIYSYEHLQIIRSLLQSGLTINMTDYNVKDLQRRYFEEDTKAIIKYLIYYLLQGRTQNMKIFLHICPSHWRI